MIQTDWHKLHVGQGHWDSRGSAGQRTTYAVAAPMVMRVMVCESDGGDEDGEDCGIVVTSAWLTVPFLSRSELQGGLGLLKAMVGSIQIVALTVTNLELFMRNGDVLLVVCQSLAVACFLSCSLIRPLARADNFLLALDELREWDVAYLSLSTDLLAQPSLEQVELDEIFS